MKNPQFLSKFDETLPKYPKHELVKLTMFHQFLPKIVDFSLIAYFESCIVRFASVSIWVKDSSLCSNFGRKIQIKRFFWMWKGKVIKSTTWYLLIVKILHVFLCVILIWMHFFSWCNMQKGASFCQYLREKMQKNARTVWITASQIYWYY